MRRFIPARAGNTRPRSRGVAGAPVHPRSRGEHSFSGNGAGWAFGSSPLARGTPDGCHKGLDPLRFIPARAGNTRTDPGAPAARSVHPRSRGEHPGRAGEAGEVHRFIPARAGNTWTRGWPRRQPPVHPRSRGEHYALSDLGTPADGSSPLARGTPSSSTPAPGVCRFIPARAGNTLSVRNSRSTWGGSSPLARGTPADAPDRHDRDRFIPARAGNTWGVTSPSPSQSVHPRSRGEHHPGLHVRMRGFGSSPLARGTLGLRILLRGTNRFIPARAGNTQMVAAATGESSVHPRSRGEHPASWIAEQSMNGSSPLARGTRPRGDRGCPRFRFIPARAGNTDHVPAALAGLTVHPRSRGEHVLALVAPAARVRFIPARAGNTVLLAGSGPWPAVHPRSRGEHNYCGSAVRYVRGSSPLARGTHHALPQDVHIIRFIPARAGNTRTRPRSAGSTSVHPRSRGEHLAFPGPGGEVIGSSPLARGTLHRSDRRRTDDRFIPARAGNTRSTRPSPRGGPVHPRSRGEHVVNVLPLCLENGSSPLARGTHMPTAAEQTAGRFIPARAGNTETEASSSRIASVHPRSRGEHGPENAFRHLSTGSSPLARGTRFNRDRQDRDYRFIPARAGNTVSGSPAETAAPVHPRSRGEHEVRRRVLPGTHGSSPLARGTPAGVGRLIHSLRFIPARAGNTPRRPAPPPPRAVHPRSRGEHPRPIRPRNAKAGSSPLARGTRGDRRGHRPQRRFIPARAGNTWRGTARRIPRAVHPRSRGEHHRDSREIWAALGSSPLARGTRRGHRRAGADDRFIPARAGNTPRMAASTAARPVHPRSRGEHCPAVPAGAADVGSSPLARGTHPHDRERAVLHRFIPARAGNTTPSTPRAATSPVHPRSRGEHRWCSAIHSATAGSSPLARGTQLEAHVELAVLRFIPARAGNTESRSCLSPGRPVHPRSRGEHNWIACSRSETSGSSPLARGTPTLARRAYPRPRFIPARAGNTCRRPPPARFPAVHPRSRGEHIERRVPSRPPAGSSPLAWGTRAVPSSRLRRNRFIPARAGNTTPSTPGAAALPVHPRSRGEHAADAVAASTPCGSSPLARGTRL